MKKKKKNVNFLKKVRSKQVTYSTTRGRILGSDRKVIRIVYTRQWEGIGAQGVGKTPQTSTPELVCV